MSFTWKLSLVILGAVVITVAAETLAAKTINLKVAGLAGEAWLAKSHDKSIGIVTEQTYAQLELGSTLVADGLIFDERSTERLGPFERAGWFWTIVNKQGSAKAHSADACIELNADLKLEAWNAPRRGSTTCKGARPALVVSAQLGPDAWLILGRRLDASWARTVSETGGADVTVWGPSGQLISTANDPGGRMIPLAFEVDGRTLSQPEPGFHVAELSVPGYQGYLFGLEPTLVGVGQFTSFVFAGPLSGAPGLPVRVAIWAPSQQLTGGGYYSKLILLGSLLVLPFLLAFAWLVGRRVSQPLNQLVEAAQQIEAGNLDVKAPSSHSGEVGALAQAFDKMVAGLRDAQARVVVSEKMAAIGQLAGGVAHEINNPLGVILGFSQGMEQRLKKDDALRMPVTSIVREALRCKALVQELLVFARTGKKVFEPLDLNAVTLATTTLLEARARTQSVKVAIELSAGALPLNANRTQLQQVIVNLGTNALDAMEAGGTLTLRTRHANARTVLEVCDTGTGIDEKIQTRIFEPFFTTKDLGRGTGLGLSLVHEIVKQHGGDIHVDSKKGRGTTIQILLPAVAS